ncbi:hypothetical protein NE237_031982 [Protea cynaroides]|uniref:Uncharacterized protein n=1 Tax=Protea cynaroides TaxID=273540 RepID=A0A9Q0R2N0_9MAGN|nr:hypothetical protein NE237_031982 [Protea cynaroides]
MRSILCVLIRRPDQIVPELLLLQLLKTMMHPDVETRIGAHQIFAVILVLSSNNPRHDLVEKDSAIVEKHGIDTQDDLKDRESGYEEWKQGWAPKNSPNFYKISCSIIDRTAGPACLTEAEPKITKLSEDQMPYLIASRFKVDPFLGIGDDLQLYIKLQADVREYGSAADHQAASSFLSKLRETFHESDKVILDILVGSLSRATEHMMPSYGDFKASSSVEDDVISESSVVDLSCFIPKMPTSVSLSHVISVGQLLESALEMADQVARISVSRSPLPYSTMASHCEALDTGSWMKLSSWLAHETHIIQN